MQKVGAKKAILHPAVVGRKAQRPTRRCPSWQAAPAWLILGGLLRRSCASPPVSSAMPLRVSLCASHLRGVGCLALRAKLPRRAFSAPRKRWSKGSGDGEAGTCLHDAGSMTRTQAASDETVVSRKICGFPCGWALNGSAPSLSLASCQAFEMS